MTFALSTIVGSAILYRDFEGIGLPSLINFAFGCLVSGGGAFALTPLLFSLQAVAHRRAGVLTPSSETEQASTSSLVMLPPRAAARAIPRTKASRAVPPPPVVMAAAASTTSLGVGTRFLRTQRPSSSTSQQPTLRLPAPPKGSETPLQDHMHMAHRRTHRRGARISSSNPSPSLQLRSDQLQLRVVDDLERSV